MKNEKKNIHKRHYVLVELSYCLQPYHDEPNEMYATDRKISVWECKKDGDNEADNVECYEICKDLISEEKFCRLIDVMTEHEREFDLGNFVAEAIKLKNGIGKIEDL